MSRIDEIISTFESIDEETRLELLLDYARKLPALPEHLQEQADAGVNKVPECMTPVFLFVQNADGAVRIHAGVAEEAPTVQGFLSILIDAFSGRPPQEILRAPQDLIHPLGLANAIRMTRMVGLTAIQARIRREVEHLDAAARTEQESESAQRR